MTAHAVLRSNAESTLIKQFEAQGELARSPQRAAAFKRFAERGLPTRRVESWHYTDLRAAMADAAPLAPAPDRTAIETVGRAVKERKKLGAARLVLINGRLIEAMADPGSYLALRKTWKDGDTITLSLPLELRQGPRQNPER